MINSIDIYILYSRSIKNYKYLIVRAPLYQKPFYIFEAALMLLMSLVITIIMIPIIIITCCIVILIFILAYIQHIRIKNFAAKNDKS